jgi:hypothetical protein
MRAKQTREYIVNHLKSYRVQDLLDVMTDAEMTALYKQIFGPKAWELERRLIDFAVMELDRFRYVLYTERHYEDLLIDKACIECLRYENLCCQERKYYVRRPQS